jgi:dienelactone hydrolase
MVQRTHRALTRRAVLKAAGAAAAGGYALATDTSGRVTGDYVVKVGSHNMHVYEAGHAFHADYRPSHRPDAAPDGWKCCVAWFKKYLA